MRALFPSRGAYRRFVEEGIGENSLWAGLRGQIYLGSEDFLKRVERRLPGRPVKGIARSHLEPLRPGAAAIEAGVAKAYRMAPDRVLHRASGEAYKAAVYLLRRAANLPLAEVAKCVDLSTASVADPSGDREGQDD